MSRHPPGLMEVVDVDQVVNVGQRLEKEKERLGKKGRKVKALEKSVYIWRRKFDRKYTSQSSS